MPPVPPRRRRARPVADAPIDPLLLRSEDLTKGWLLALLEDAPLEAASGILAADLTRDGPRVCDAALRAIASDTDLRRLEPGGALRPLAARVGELAGAAAPADVARAVDALQAVLWSAVRDELRSPDPDLVSELTERLALVAEHVRGAALERTAAPGSGWAAARPVAPDPIPNLPLRPAPAPAAEPEPPRPASVSEPPRPSSVSEPPRPAPSADPPPAAPAFAPPARGPAWPDDARRARTDALWIGALEDEIRQSAGASLSLLLAELEDGERVSAARTPAEATETFSRFAGAVRSAVRRQDILVCESDARAWIIARDTSRAGAYALGERVANAVRHSDTWQGVPLAASVGVAVLGEDGRTSAELIDAAEEARFGAAARGVDVLRDDEGREP